MFVIFLYRVRANDPGSAVVLCEQHMEREKADVYTPLYLVSFGTGERAVLVGADDWRKRRRRAETFHDTLADEAATLRFARKLRTEVYFHLLEGSTALRSMRQKLQREYDAIVDGPDTERTFFAATDPLFRDAVRPLWNEELSGPVEKYIARRAGGIVTLLRYTTRETYPFATAGPDIYASRCFDLGGEGATYYVIMDVHM